ncbi:BQ5605_C119g13280 [Microbotryum silenes-dioicae]|uniref:BQ5605_C119g13280 protein n=1 Tax=Microbotryum silenes-dioicae TaxID=796604 RepID=A0A2X0PHN4_9BASI|nr:BQ5605_C119g13280 [Microbotryum silenes-dioicae]
MSSTFASPSGIWHHKGDSLRHSSVQDSMTGIIDDQQLCPPKLLQLTTRRDRSDLSQKCSQVESDDDHDSVQ